MRDERWVSVTEGDTCVCVCMLCGKKPNGMTGPSLGRTVRTRSGKLDPPWPSERLPREKAGREKQMGWKTGRDTCPEREGISDTHHN